MSFRAAIKKHHLDGPKVLDRAGIVFVGAAVTPIFTVVRGHILLIALTGRVVAFNIAAGANLAQCHAPGNVALDFNTLDIDGLVVGTNLIVPGNGAAAIGTAAAALIPITLPWDCVVGNFTFTAAANTTPGQIQWSLAYLPCTEDALVIVA